MSDIRLVQVKNDLTPHLSEVVDLLPDGWKVTLVARNPNKQDQFLTLSNDNLTEAANAIREAVGRGIKL